MCLSQNYFHRRKERMQFTVSRSSIFHVPTEQIGIEPQWFKYPLMIHFETREIFSQRRSAGSLTWLWENSTAFNISKNTVNIFLTILSKAENKEAIQWYYFDIQNLESKSSVIYFFYFLNSSDRSAIKSGFLKKLNPILKMIMKCQWCS